MQNYTSLLIGKMPAIPGLDVSLNIHVVIDSSEQYYQQLIFVVTHGGKEKCQLVSNELSPPKTKDPSDLVKIEVLFKVTGTNIELYVVDVIFDKNHYRVQFTLCNGELDINCSLFKVDYR